MSEQHTERLRRWASQEEDRDHELHTERVRRTTEPTWTTREGERIPIREMGDRHLVNTIRYLRRERLRVEIQRARSHELLFDEADGGCVEQLMDMDREEALAKVCPAYPHLLAEAKRRGLEIEP